MIVEQCSYCQSTSVGHAPDCPVKQTTHSMRLVVEASTLPCRHDFVFLREKDEGTGLLPARVDVFYCRHCLTYREVGR